MMSAAKNVKKVERACLRHDIVPDTIESSGQTVVQNRDCRTTNKEQRSCGTTLQSRVSLSNDIDLFK